MLNSRALEARERLLGPEYPPTLTSMSNLATVLCSRGDYARAEPLFRRALAGRERILGLTHPNTLKTLINLADLLAKTNNGPEAEALRDEHRRRKANTGLA